MGSFLRQGWRQTVAFTGCLLALAAIYFFADRGQLRLFESYVTYYWLSLALLLTGVAFARLGGPLWSWWKLGWPETRQRRLLTAGVLLSLAGFVLTHAEPSYRMLSDEHNHLQVAQAMYHYHRAERCDEGHFLSGILECKTFVTELRPKTYPLLLSMVYAITGETGDVAFGFNFVLYFLCGLLLFRLTYELQAGFAGALGSLLAWSLWPISIWWARTAGYEMTYAFFLLLATALGCFTATLAARPAREQLWGAGLLGLVSAFACQTRHEAIIMMPVFLIPALPFLWRNVLPGCVAVVTWFVAVIPLAVVRGVFKMDFIEAQRGHAAISWENLARNLPLNLDFLLNRTGEWPTVTALTLAAAVGGAWLAWDCRSRRSLRALTLVMALWMVNVLVFMSIFYWGTFQLIVHMRYSLGLYPPMALATGYGVAKLLARWPVLPLRAALLGGAVLIAFLEAGTLQDSRLQKKVHLPLEDQLLAEEMRKLPANSVFYYTRPAAFLVRHRSSYSYAHLEAMNDESWDWISRRSDGNQYYVRGLDCWRGKRPNFQEIDAWNACDRVEQLFKLEPYVTRRVLDDFDVRIMKVVGLRGGPGYYDPTRAPTASAKNAK